VVHLVCVTKYRRWVVDARALDCLANHALYVFDKMRCRLLACDGEADHLHMLVEYPPKHSIGSGQCPVPAQGEARHRFPLSCGRRLISRLNRRRHVARRQTVCRTAEAARFLLALPRAEKIGETMGKLPRVSPLPIRSIPRMTEAMPKLIAVLSRLASAADLPRAGSMDNKSAILMLADALEACWEIKKGSEAIQPAA
jgi:REP element-mobilizing transposase RayT